MLSMQNIYLTTAAFCLASILVTRPKKNAVPKPPAVPEKRAFLWCSVLWEASGSSTWDLQNVTLSKSIEEQNMKVFCVIIGLLIGFGVFSDSDFHRDRVF